MKTRLTLTTALAAALVLTQPFDGGVLPAVAQQGSDEENASKAARQAEREARKAEREAAKAAREAERAEKRAERAEEQAEAAEEAEAEERVQELRQQRRTAEDEGRERRADQADEELQEIRRERREERQAGETEAQTAEEIQQLRQERRAAREAGDAEAAAEAREEIREIRADRRVTAAELDALDGEASTSSRERITDDLARSSSEEVEDVQAERQRIREERRAEREAAREDRREAREERAEGDDGDGKRRDLKEDLAIGLGSAAAGIAIGAIAADYFGGGRVVDQSDDRAVVQSGNDFYVLKDENELLYRPGVEVANQTYDNGFTRTIVDRPDGSQIVTIRDEAGFVVRRTKVDASGQEFVLVDETSATDPGFVNAADLPYFQDDRLALNDPDFAVDYADADRDRLRRALTADTRVETDRTFTLRQVRRTAELRALMPQIDLDAITFATGSAAIAPEQAETLVELGEAMEAIIAENPRELFLIEGHTDAVGGEVTNLKLSDRRAESVALALTEYFDVPPENLVTQGYGEEFLKVASEGAEQANRRATVRRITPLVAQGS